MVEQRPPKPPVGVSSTSRPAWRNPRGRWGREAARQSVKLVSSEVADASPARPTAKHYQRKQVVHLVCEQARVQSLSLRLHLIREPQRSVVGGATWAGLVARLFSGCVRFVRLQLSQLERLALNQTLPDPAPKRLTQPVALSRIMAS
jgi:hypothetical protein